MHAAEHPRLGRVAIKVLPARDERRWRAARRELIGLRQARLPGIVPLLDESWQSGYVFIVMRFVAGAPFPGPIPRTWAALREPACRLLAALHRLHCRGLLHLDLKPRNVLVDPSGQLTIVDLGLARPTAQPAGRFAGTLGYAAPEQFEADGQLGPAADLFAVGVMLHEALSGHLPNGAPLPEACAPAAIRAAIAQLTRADPQTRIGHAAAALAALGGDLDQVRPPLATLPPISTAAELTAVFAGPERFLHLRSDAARLLFARSSGHAAAVRTTLAAWIDDGRVYWWRGKAHVSRDALDQMTAGGDAAAPTPTTRALRASLAAGEPAPEILPLVEACVREGQLREAWPAISSLLDRVSDDLSVSRRLYALLVVVALSAESPEPIEDAMLAIERGPDDGALRRLEWLLRAARAARSGEIGVAQKALNDLERYGPFEDEQLEHWRMSAYVSMDASEGIEARRGRVDALRVWAGASPTRQAAVAGWLGHLYYESSAFAEAARQYDRARRGKSHALGRLSSAHNHAMALLDGLQAGEAHARARAVQDEARRLRHSRYEASAHWIERAAAYRLGHTAPVDDACIDAATAVGGALGGLFALTGAAVDWRAGRLDRAYERAARAIDALWPAGYADHRALMRALQQACRPDAAHRGPALHAALGCARPRLTVQALSLLAPVPEDARDAALAIIDAMPPGDRGARLEIVSFAEARARLTGHRGFQLDCPFEDTKEAP